MGWYRTALLAILVTWPLNSAVPARMKATGSRQVEAATKKAEATSSAPKILYGSGVIRYPGARLMGFNPAMVIDTFTSGIDTTFWTVVDGNADGVTWDTSSIIPGAPTGFGNPPGAVYDDDAAGGGAPPGVEALISGPIDFTGYVNGDQVFLKFYSSFQIYFGGGGEYATVAIQPQIFGVWGAWDTVWLQINADRAGYEIVDLSNYALADSIKIAFTFTDTSGEWGWGWGVDDIMIGTLSSDVMLAEDFETCTMPAGWSVIDSNADGTSWLVGTTPDLHSFTPPNYGTCYAYYSDDDAGSGAPAGQEWLISPAVSVAGYSSVGFSYDFGFDIIDTQNEIFHVYLRTFDGTAWSAWQEVASYSGADIAQHEDLDVSTFLPAESLQVAFAYEDLDGGWYWAVGVDNVTIYEIVPPAVDVGIVSLDPGMAGVAPPTFTPTVVARNFGLTQQTYQVNFQIEDPAGTILFADSVVLDYRHGGTLDSLAFAPYNANVGDTLVLKAWATVGGDQNPNNDLLQYTVVVVNANDVAVSAISGASYGDPVYAYPFTLQVDNVGALDQANVDIRFMILDITAGNTVVHDETLSVANLAAQTSITLTSTPFQPVDVAHDYQLVAYPLAADDFAGNDTATATFTTQVAPFGTVLASWTDTTLANYDLAGVTYREDADLFYAVSMNTASVLTIDPYTGTVGTAFPITAFGAAGGDIPWGIAWDPTLSSFWVGQIGCADANCSTVAYMYAARYDTQGVFTGDTVNLLTLTNTGYMAGMDYFPKTWENNQLVGGYFWMVGVADPSWGNYANIWKVDLHSGTVLAQIPNPDPSSYRGMAYLARGLNWVLLGGWNQGQLQLWDSTLSSMVFSATAGSMADVDIWENPAEIAAGAPQMKALVVTNTVDNQFFVVALGAPWNAVGVEEGNRRTARALRFLPGPRVIRGQAEVAFSLPTSQEVRLALYDGMGRRVKTLAQGVYGPGLHRITWDPARLGSGLYFYRFEAGGKTFNRKVVVVH